MESYLLLIFAGLAAGALNAIAGGGTFISFPALVWIGIPPVAANASATLAALPGYVSSAYAFRQDIRGGKSLPVGAVMGASAIGGIVGAVLLLSTSEQAFSGIVPWLLAFATLAFACGPAVTRTLGRNGSSTVEPVPALLILLGVTIYGGYFNGGVGILLLAAFGLVGLTDLKEMNGLKNLVSSLLSAVSVAIYMVADLIAWEEAMVLGVACALGGYVGSTLSRRVSDTALIRGFITLTGTAMSIAFFID